MPEFEFDVDASIAAGWNRFAVHLADLLRDLAAGGTFDLAVPVLGAPSARTPCIRFTRPASDVVHAEVSDGALDDPPVQLSDDQHAQLAALGWVRRTPSPASGAYYTAPDGRVLELAHLVAGTMERVFGVPHPVFLHDVPDPGTEHTPAPGADPGSALAEDADFRPLPISCPDEATRAIGTALAEVYARAVPADENDVFTVPAGCVLLFVRAHRSLPLIVFRSPLVAAVADVDAAETEIAVLNRDSLWCRYVFDGETVYAESEHVDRVFVPVNFKIQLTEVTAELDDVYEDLARRVGGKRWHDLRASEERRQGEK